MGFSQQAESHFAIQVGKLEAMEGASIGEEFFVRHRATKVVLGADPPHDLKGMKPTHIGPVHLLVAKGALFLNDSSNIMLLTTHIGIKEAEPDEKWASSCCANQVLEDPTLGVSEFGDNEGTGGRGRGRLG